MPGNLNAAIVSLGICACILNSIGIAGIVGVRGIFRIAGIYGIVRIACIRAFLRRGRRRRRDNNCAAHRDASAVFRV